MYKDKYNYLVQNGESVCYVTGTGSIDLAVYFRGYLYPFLSDGTVSPYPIVPDAENTIVLNYGSLPYEFLAGFAQWRAEHDG